MAFIQNIETDYGGYRFRSRLEARWAVFFDALGVEYEYEPEGFELPSGRRYLPDFRIKCYGTRGDCGNAPFDLWVEVKGRMSQGDADKVHEFCKTEHVESYDWGKDEWYEIHNPILIVGDIPNPETYSAQSSDLHNYEGMDGINIYPWNYETIDGDYFAAYPAVKNGRFYLDGDDSNYQTMDLSIVRAAFRAARQARFEYGEKPVAPPNPMRELPTRELVKHIIKTEAQSNQQTRTEIMQPSKPHIELNHDGVIALLQMTGKSILTKED